MKSGEIKRSFGINEKLEKDQAGTRAGRGRSAMISATRSLVLVFLCLTIALLAATRGAPAEQMILHDAQSLREADATRVVITKLETISDRGFYPRFSPSGTSILYTVDESRFVFLGRASLWLMDLNGKNKRMVVANAHEGAWSVDGKRLAYFANRPHPKHPQAAYWPTLAIYDLQMRKEYEIMPNFNTNFGSQLYSMLWWTSDGQKIYVDGGGLVDLNTLEFTNTGTVSLRDKLPLFRHVHPKIRFGIDGTGVLWAKNLDGSFSRALLPSSFGVWSPGLTMPPEIEISPDLSKLAITLKGHPNGNITLAHLGVLPEAPVRVFQARIARADLVEPQNVVGHLGFRSDAILEEYLRFGSITATVYEQRVNPLNGRVVGPGKVVKGEVRIRKLLNDRLIVEVVRESLPIQAGDVLADIQGNPPKDSGLGTRNILKPLWAVLEATAR